MKGEKPDITIPSAEDFLKEMREMTSRDVRTEFIGRIVTIVIAGLGLISVLAWDEALKNLYASIVKNAESMSGKFWYAVIITFLGAVASMIISHIFLKKKK